MKNLLIISLGIFLLLPGIGLGATREPIEGGHLIYRDGTFDPLSFNADIRDGRILLEDGTSGRFDHLIARSRFDADTGKQIIDRLQVENLQLLSNGQNISIARILVIGGRTEETVNWGNLRVILGVDLLACAESFDIEGIRVNRHGIDIMGIDKMQLRLDSPDVTADFPEYDLEAAFTGIRIASGVRGEILPPLLPGKDHYVANIIVEGDASIDGGLYGGRSRMAFEIEGIGKFDLDVATSHDMDELESMGDVLENTPEDHIDRNDFLRQLAAASYLNHVTLEVTDEGALRALYDYYTTRGPTEEEIQAAWLTQLQLAIFPYIPLHSAEFIEQAEIWLREGGRLKLSLHPDEPVQLDSLATPEALSNLDHLLQMLNTTLEHH